MSDSNFMRLPLFPLHTVLFPGGLLPLRVFEPRYLDMVSRAIRKNSSFGICLIAVGNEVGEAAIPHPIGTEALIDSWSTDAHGIMSIVVRGARRFCLADHELEHDGLLVGKVRWLPEPPAYPIPEAQNEILPLLRELIRRAGERVALPYRFDDAGWVGARYAEMLPIPVLARQSLLELNDVLIRIEIVQKFLRQHDLLGRH